MLSVSEVSLTGWPAMPAVVSCFCTAAKGKSVRASRTAAISGSPFFPRGLAACSVCGFFFGQPNMLPSDSFGSGHFVNFRYLIRCG